MADNEMWEKNGGTKRDPDNPSVCLVSGRKHYSSYKTSEIFRIIVRLMKGSNMRLKIQKGKEKY